MSAVAQAALPVAVGLFIAAVAARALDARAYLEALGMWCLIAAGITVFAIAASGEVRVLPLGVALLVGVGAALLRPAPADEPVAAEPEPEPEPAPRVQRTGGALWARPRP